MKNICLTLCAVFAAAVLIYGTAAAQTAANSGGVSIPAPTTTGDPSSNKSFDVLLVEDMLSTQSKRAQAQKIVQNAIRDAINNPSMGTVAEARRIIAQQDMENGTNRLSTIGNDVVASVTAALQNSTQTLINNITGTVMAQVAKELQVGQKIGDALLSGATGMVSSALGSMFGGGGTKVIDGLASIRALAMTAGSVNESASQADQAAAVSMIQETNGDLTNMELQAIDFERQINDTYGSPDQLNLITRKDNDGKSAAAFRMAATDTTQPKQSSGGGTAFDVRMENYEKMMSLLSQKEGEKSQFIQKLSDGDMKAIAEALDPAAEKGTSNQDIVKEQGLINKDLTRVAAMVFAESIVSQKKTISDQERCLKAAQEGATGSTTLRGDMSVLAQINVCTMEALMNQHVSELYRLMVNSVAQMLN